MNLGARHIDDTLTFACNTHDPATGAEVDADDAPTYRVYEDETGTPILTGSLALLDDSNTVGFYSEQIMLSAANGFEVGKSYTIRINAVVGGVTGNTLRYFHMAADDSANISAILTDTNELQTDWTDGGRLDLILDGVSNALTTIAGYVDSVEGSIAALNDLSAADVLLVLESIGLDHLLAAADPGGLVVNDSLWAKMSSSSGVYSTFSKVTDSLESIRDDQTNILNNVISTGVVAAQTYNLVATFGQDVLVSTTIAVLNSQTSFTLADGSSSDDAYNGQVIILTDELDPTQKSVGIILDYVGATKTVTLTTAPVFTIAAGSLVAVLAASSSSSSGLTQADIRTAVGMASANLDSQLSAIASATNAGDLTTKTADAAALTTGTNVSGSYADTFSDNDTYWITAPTASGLRQQLTFDLPLGRVPVGIYVRGWWNGSSQTAEVYALNSRTGVYDKLTNSGTNLASRNNELGYTFMLPRDYADNSGGSFNVVTLEFRSASTNTGHRLRLDQVLVSHVNEAVATTSTSITAFDVWNYVDRTLTTPNSNPVVPPTAAEIVTAIDSTSSKLDAAVSTRLAASSYTAPDNASIADILVDTGTTIPALIAAIPTAPDPAAVVAAVFDQLIETGVTFQQLCEALGAAIAGKRSSVGTIAEQFDAIGNPGTPRIVTNADSDGNGEPTLTL